MLFCFLGNFFAISVALFAIIFCSFFSFFAIVNKKKMQICNVGWEALNLG